MPNEAVAATIMSQSGPAPPAAKGGAMHGCDGRQRHLLKSREQFRSRPGSRGAPELIR